MKTISNTIVALYYRRPYEDEKEFICACESGECANQQIEQLLTEYPDAYPSPERFETSLIRYVRRAY